MTRSISPTVLYVASLAADALMLACAGPAMTASGTASRLTSQPADLGLLDANPLADNTNTQRIRAVVVNGRQLDRAALDAMLTHARIDSAKERPARDSISHT